MHALRELQRSFADAILARAPAAFAPQVRDRGLAPAERVQIYQNNVFISLTEALADVYPVVAKLVGEAFFAFLARSYIRAHPSRSGNLHDFGAELPAHLAVLPEAAGLAYLPDVAELEWARHAVFHAADAGTIDARALAAVPDERLEDLRFALHPAVRLLASRYPLLAIWHANQLDPAGEVDLDRGSDCVLVTRRDFDIRMDALTPGEFALLAAFADDLAFGDACERALAAEPGLDLGAAMGRFVADGTLAGFD
jgi:hypothetical protein